MVGATLPFQFGAGAKTAQRPIATSGAGFAGAMDEAIGAPAARRDDTPRPAPARSRRPEPAPSKRADDADATRAPRRSSSDVRTPAADRVDDGPADREVVARANREEEAAAPDTIGNSEGESVAPPAEDTDKTPKAIDGSEGEVADDIEGEVVFEAGAEDEAEALAALGESGEGDAGVQATGEKHPIAAAALKGDREATVTDDGRARGRGWGGASGLPEHGEEHHVARARAEMPPQTGGQMGELAKAAAQGALGQTGAGAAQAASAGAKAAEQTPSPAQAAAEEAVAAFAEAGAAVESVAAAESSASADMTDSGAQERDQPPRAAAPATRMGDAVAAASGLSDGVRFTATSAAGSAAYASAAPRPEVHVLPQIVQSIKLQTAQGTSEARVQLRPEHLGALNIALKVENGHVTATIHAENPAVRQWIEANETSLRQALTEQGLQLSKLVVHPDGEQAETEGREQEPRRQQQRRSWRDEDVTFEVVV